MENFPPIQTVRYLRYKMKKIVEVAYKFKIEYKHEDHLKSIKKDLRNNPIHDMGGAG